MTTREVKLRLMFFVLVKRVTGVSSSSPRTPPSGTCFASVLVPKERSMSQLRAVVTVPGVRTVILSFSDSAESERRSSKSARLRIEIALSPNDVRRPNSPHDPRLGAPLPATDGPRPFQSPNVDQQLVILSRCSSGTRKWSVPNPIRGLCTDDPELQRCKRSGTGSNWPTLTRDWLRKREPSGFCSCCTIRRVHGLEIGVDLGHAAADSAATRARPAAF
jgi:hypothetical protein